MGYISGLNIGNPNLGDTLNGNSLNLPNLTSWDGTFPADAAFASWYNSGSPSLTSLSVYGGYTGGGTTIDSNGIRSDLDLVANLGSFGRTLNASYTSDTSYYYPFLNFNRFRTSGALVQAGDYCGGNNFYGSGYGVGFFWAGVDSVVGGVPLGRMGFNVGGGDGSANHECFNVTSTRTHFNDNVEIHGETTPTDNDTYSLGSSTLKWKNITATKSVSADIAYAGNIVGVGHVTITGGTGIGAAANGTYYLQDIGDLSTTTTPKGVYYLNGDTSSWILVNYAGIGVWYLRNGIGGEGYYLSNATPTGSYAGYGAYSGLGTPTGTYYEGGVRIDVVKAQKGQFNNINIKNLPTSAAGLSAGDVWVDTTGGLNILKII